MSELRLDEIRHCLEGTLPAMVATCADDGTPNATYVSQMQYVDLRHVALSFQFFNRTRANILVNPQATAMVVDPLTAASYRLELLYLRTETDGPLFQRMRAKLAGIAAISGMADVFRLRGSDIYRVLSARRLSGAPPACTAGGDRRLAALRRSSEALAGCATLEALVDCTLATLAQEFELPHLLWLVADEAARQLYTVGSRGYAATGVGSEVAFGEGVIGVAAEHRTAIRINHRTLDYRYGRAAGDEAAAEPRIPFPGLAAPNSQLAVPLLSGGRLLGVLCVESSADMAFGHELEDALVTLAAQMGAQMRALQQEAETEAGTATEPAGALAPEALPLLDVRHYAANDSVFIGGDYLIKGVPGAILWKLLRLNQESGRCDFSNRELRLAPDLRLPEISDNLEARLILLQRRLAERCPLLEIQKTGRGLFRLQVGARLRLSEAGQDELRAPARR